jgi:hypothetical protein
MDNIYDTLAKLNKVANAPKIVKEDSNALMKKGLEDLMKKTKLNKQADYKPFGKGDKDYETGLPKDAKKDKMFDDMAAADASKMNKQKNYTPFSDKQSPDGLPEKKKDNKMFEGPGGQTKHELIRQLFKTHFGQPQYNELTGGRSGMRRLKIITGTTRGTGYEFANDGPGQDTSDFEKAIGKAGLSGDVRVKSNGTAITVLYPDQFRMQSLAEASWPKSDDDESAPQVGDTVMHDKYGMLKVVKISDQDMMGEPAEYIVQTKSGKKKISYDRLVMGESVNEAELVEKESDVERDDRAEKAGREVKRDAKYDRYRHAGKDGKSVTKDIEYDEKHDKDGMHEAQGYDDKEDESLGMRTGKEADKKQSMKDRRDDSYGKFGKRDKEHEDGKMHMGENSGTLKDAARQGVMARLAELAGIPAQEIEEALGTPQDIADKIMSEDPLDEADVEEGNEFSGNRDDAIKAGKDSFEVDGKTYPVKGDKNESLEESDIDQIADVGKVYSKINKMKMDLVDKGMEPEDAQDKACEKYDCDPSMYDKYVEMKRDSREGTKKNESLEESDIDQIAEVGKVYPKIAKLKMKLVDDGMEPEDAHDEACEKYNVDPAMCDKYIEMQRDSREGTKKESQELDESALKDMMQDVEEGMDKAEFEKKYPGQDYDDIKKDIEDRMDETTSSGSVATSEGAGKPLYPNASVYESNEIVKRAKQLNEDMSFTISGGPEQEPNLNINASGTEAQQLAQLLKLSGLGMTPAAPQYGEVEIQVAEDQEFANGADDENTMDIEYMTQDIAGGLNGPKKMAYPKVAGGDNPMSVLGESELNEVGAERLMKLYQAYKAK